MKRSTSARTPGIFANPDAADPVRRCHSPRRAAAALGLLVILMPQMAAAEGRIYWVHSLYPTGSMKRASLDGSDVETLPLDPVHGVALDVASDRLFYTEYADGFYSLVYTNLDGTDAPTVVTSRPYPHTIWSIALDVAEDQVYWSEANSCKIQRAGISSGSVELLVSAGSGCSSSLELDLRPSERKMYYGSGGTIYRNNLEGAAEETVVSLGTHILGLAIDTAYDQIYAVGATQAHLEVDRTWVKRIDFDGTNVVTIFEEFITPSALDIEIDVIDADVGVVYWTWKNLSLESQVYSVSTTGGTPALLVTGSVGGYRGIDIDPCIDGPDSPVGVDAADGTSCAEVSVTWTAVPDADGYRIWRSTVDDSATAAQIGSSTTTAYQDAIAAPGTTYYYWVRAVNICGTSAFGSSDSGWRAQAPSITTQPTDQSACVGDSATLTVAATGDLVLTYAWFTVGGTTVLGTGDTFTIPFVVPADDGAYEVVVTNDCGSVTSLPATLTVNTAPEITAPPTDQLVDDGGTTTFEVATTGTPPPAFQWRKWAVELLDDPGHISGATTATLTITGVRCDDAGVYDVVVSNECGSVVSPTATLTLDIGACPPSGPDYVVETYEVAGDASGTPWSWRLESADSSFTGTPVIDVPGVATGGALAVAQAFADSINAYAAANGCPIESLWANADSIFGTVSLSIRTGCGSQFTLYVGAAGGPADCEVALTLPACSFNPTIEQLALPGLDCNGNGWDDFIDILTGTSTDFNGNGIPDECEGLGDLNCDGAVDFFDIDPFVLAVTDSAGYAAVYPDCDIMSADCNGDGLVDFFDIDGFVAIITGG